MKQVILQTYIILFSLLVLTTKGQTQKIKIKKEVCTFNLMADSSLLNKKLKLADANSKGLSANEQEIITQKFPYKHGNSILINIDSLRKGLNSICSIGNKKIQTVYVESLFNHPESIYLVLKYN